MNWLEITGLCAGIVQVILEVFHNKWTWPFEIVACTAFLLIYLPVSLWGNAAIQVYYIVMAVVGLLAWNRDGKKTESGDEILIRQIPARTLLISLVIFISGSAVAALLFKNTGNPRPLLDGMVTVLSLLATWWLTRSYIEQWLLWIAADGLNVLLFVLQSADGVAGSAGPLIMNTAYLLSSFVGLAYWKKKGKYISS